jgi:hypothetical protein
LERAVTFVEDLLKRTTLAQSLTGRPAYVAARTARLLALKAAIAPATLTRARWELGIKSVKTRTGWTWIARQSQ